MAGTTFVQFRRDTREGGIAVIESGDDLGQHYSLAVAFLDKDGRTDAILFSARNGARQRVLILIWNATKQL